MPNITPHALALVARGLFPDVDAHLDRFFAEATRRDADDRRARLDHDVRFYSPDQARQLPPERFVTFEPLAWDDAHRLALQERLSALDAALAARFQEEHDRIVAAYLGWPFPPRS